MATFKLFARCVTTILSISIFHIGPCGASASPALLGVNLGASYISSAMFNASGPVAIARIEGNNAYKAFLLDVLHGSATSLDESPKAATAIFSEALIQIRDEARRLTGDKSVRIGAISYPANISDYAPSGIWALFSSFNELDPEVRHPIRLRPAYYGAMLTYPPGHCLDDWGSDREIDDYDPYVLIFEHDGDRLQIRVGQVGKWGTSIYGSETLTWPPGKDELHASIQRVVVDGKAVLNNITAVIVGAGDEVTDTSIVDQALEVTFPNLVPKIQNPVVGRHYVAAAGAACIARQFVLRPEIVRPGDPEYKATHDEL